ncbi:hypothetical protein Tco_0185730 [Tanacetum coccineum]
MSPGENLTPWHSIVGLKLCGPGDVAGNDRPGRIFHSSYSVQLLSRGHVARGKGPEENAWVSYQTTFGASSLVFGNGAGSLVREHVYKSHPRLDSSKVVLCVIRRLPAPPSPPLQIEPYSRSIEELPNTHVATSRCLVVYNRKVIIGVLIMGDLCMAQTKLFPEPLPSYQRAPMDADMSLFAVDANLFCSHI